MSQSVVAERTVARGRKASGAEIRARIDANTRKRRDIAERMKREAGVRGHLENRKEMSGLAWTDLGCIETPESRNIANLYVLAHECGHVFLHMTGVGRLLPAHVMEYEAECYAHQALKHHHMNVPAMHTSRARRYVAAMIVQDRARDLPISPAAERFASGMGSPYAQLRCRPKPWRATCPPATLHDLYPVYVVEALHNIEAMREDAAQKIINRHIGKCYIYPTLAVTLGAGAITGQHGSIFDFPLAAICLVLYLTGRASIDWVDRILARRKAVAKFLRERNRPVTSHIVLATDAVGRPILKQLRPGP